MVYNDFKDTNGRWVKACGGKAAQGKTFSGQRWYNMKVRCKSEDYQRANPTYVGCILSEEFEDFQIFTDWHVQQVGYGLPDYRLDKDLLIEGNRLYSENTCVLIPHQLNMFISAQYGKDTVGVHVDSRRGHIYAATSVGGKTIRIGTFSTYEEAQEAYYKAKKAEAANWYERLCNKEFIVDERVIERLKIMAGLIK